MLLASSFAHAFPAETFGYKGEFAWASFYGGEGCVARSVFIGMGEQVTRQGHGKPAASESIFVYADEYDFCSDTYLYAVGEAPLAADEADFGKQHSPDSASVSKSVELCVYIGDGTPLGCEECAVDMTWTSSGDTYRSISRFMNWSPGIKTSFRDNSTAREATVSGSIADPGEGDVLAGLSSFAFLYVSNGGSVTVWK